jgi:hypothetical protein
LVAVNGNIRIGYSGMILSNLSGFSDERLYFGNTFYNVGGGLTILVTGQYSNEW